MRIVHMAGDLRRGGMEHLIEGIINGQRARGHTVAVVLLTGGGEVAERLRQQGVEVAVAGVRRVRPPELLRVRKLLRKQRPDVVHMHGMPAGTFGRLALLRTRIRSVVHIHTALSEAHQLTRRQARRERRLAQVGGPILAVSHAVKEDLVSVVGIDLNRVEVLSGGVPDLQPLHQGASRKRFGVEEDSPLIVCLASLYEHKGVPLLVEAVSLLPQANLLIAGEGPLKRELEEMIRVLGTEDRIRLLGFVQDAHALLSAADVAALASWPREGLSLALVEAHRAGRPVVCTDVGGMPEVVEHGATGIVVPPRNVAALAEALDRLLTNEEERLSMGEAARSRFLEKWELTGYLDRLDWLYQQA